jgi:hypothetical protein
MNAGEPHQVAVEFDKPYMENDGVLYRLFIKTIDTGSLRVMGMFRMVGDYDIATCAFYATGSREDAETFSKKAKNTGLVKAVHIDVFPEERTVSEA